MGGQSIKPAIGSNHSLKNPVASDERTMEDRMVKKFDNHLYGIVVMVWLTLSVVSVFLAAVTWVELSRKLTIAREASQIESVAGEILSLMIDCETGVRGFIISGDEDYLEPYKTGKSALPKEFDRLVELSRQDSTLLQRVVELRATSELALNRLTANQESRAIDGPKASAENINLNESKALIDKLRTQVAGIRRLRSGVNMDDGADARNQLMWAGMTSLVAGIIGIGAGTFAFWLSRITLEHQKRERELTEAKLKAERSNQEKTVFLANMSHEIRTPMNAILGFGELLASEIQDAKQRHYLQSIRSSAGSLLQLINDILDMAKMEAGVITLNVEPTDPREICHFVHAMFSETAARKNVRIECIIADDLPQALLLDHIRLRQILVNLIGNAVKFTNQGSVIIRVSCDKTESSTSQIMLMIDVQDTGVGIPPDKLETIFKPFVQAGAHRDIEKQGTGLGLSIVKRLTELMNGTVTVESILGQGSIFRLRFPNVHISARIPREESMPNDKKVDFNELKPSTILIVDDSETNCELVSGLFAASHHKIIFGHTGLDAVELARQHQPDIILLDIRMPGMDGRMALAKIRKQDSLAMTPVIAVTAARSRLEPGEPDLRELFNGYVRKPFSKLELFNEIAHFIPKVSRPVAADAGAKPGSAARPLDAKPVDPELVAHLRHLLEQEWPSVRNSGAIKETREFASRLENAARKWSCEPLRQYAITLAQYADNYLVVNLEKLLDEFPALVSQFEEKVTA